jgi:flagellar basal-body rod protein FlgG
VSQIVIGRNGEVQVRQTGSSVLTTVGQVELARFVNAEGLRQIGRNLYIETDASGAPITGNPQEDGLGAIQQGMLEGSNVDPVRELIDLIQTQRAFELNSQSIQSADQSLQVVSRLRRF